MLPLIIIGIIGFIVASLFLFLLINNILELVGYPHKSIVVKAGRNNPKTAIINFREDANKVNEKMFMVTGGDKKFFEDIKKTLFNLIEEKNIKIEVITEDINPILEKIQKYNSVNVYKMDTRPSHHFRIIDDYRIMIEDIHDRSVKFGKHYKIIEYNRYKTGKFLRKFHKYLSLPSTYKIA
ncbi:hypothetical protein ES703_05862 [subsurface metagenome]